MSASTSISSTSSRAVLGSAVLSEDLKAKLDKKLEDLETKIDRWVSIARKHGIDVSDELEELNRQDLDSPCIPEEFSARRFCIMRGNLASRIVSKVKSNFHREVKPEKVNQAKDALADFNGRLCVPWIRVAKRENVDINEEYQVIYQAILNEMGLINEASDFQKEVIFRRQLLTRQIATSRIVQKVYRHRIDRLAEKIKNKDSFNDERFEIVEGIRLEAQHSLPSSSDVEKLILACKKVFTIYQMNLNMYDTNPELYHKLADREVFSRSIDERARLLMEKIGQENSLRADVERTQRVAHQLLNERGYSKELQKRVNDSFNMIEERVSPAISHGCGFTGSILP